MKQKVVIRVSMNCPKSRSKAMKIVVGVLGVESAVLQGEDRDQIEVTGDGIDAVKLTMCLRKKVGFAEVVSISPVGETEEDEKKEEECMEHHLVWTPTSYPYQYYGGVHQIYEVRDPSCSIM